MGKKIVVALLIAVCLIEAGLLVYQIPAVHDRVYWKLDVLQAEIRGYLYPHPQSIATPDQARAVMMRATLTKAAAPSPTAGETEMDLPTVTPTATQYRPPIPASMTLPFNRHEYQGYNNCGPASLSMMLHFWGWDGNQNQAASYLKPNRDDKNVMPYEMERFVLEKTQYGIFVRTGGTLGDLRSLIAAGFPVIIEKGLNVVENNLGWMGHYDFLTGYIDDKRTFLTQDSYLGPNHVVDYDSLMYDWRAFDFLYLVVYPKDREQEAADILGPNADLETNKTNTLNLALSETQSLQGQPLAFAYFNLGSAHVSRLEYVDAAHAYDMARYLGLPWRFLWYQTGPYFAYYYAGRFQDVIDLANATLYTATLYAKDYLEESWYWRGMARMQLGDRQGAIDDWRQALVRHPGFAPALDQLSQIGETS